VPMLSSLNKAPGYWREMELYIEDCLGLPHVKNVGDMFVKPTYGNRYGMDVLLRYIPTRITGYFILYPKAMPSMGRKQNFDFPNDGSATARQFIKNCV